MNLPTSTMQSQSDVPPTPSESMMATWTKYTILTKHCESLSIAKKREIFAIMRNQVIGCSSDSSELYHLYLPRIGFTLGECALFHTISEHVRKHQGGK